jgi:hypothetical protein
MVLVLTRRVAFPPERRRLFMQISLAAALATSRRTKGQLP